MSHSEHRGYLPVLAIPWFCYK